MNPPLPAPTPKAEQEKLKREYYAHFTPEQLIEHLIAADAALHRLTAEQTYVRGMGKLKGIQFLFYKKGT